MFNQTDIYQIIQNVRETVNIMVLTMTVRWLIHTMWTWQHWPDIRTMTIANMLKKVNDKKLLPIKTCIGIWLSKLRSGMSNWLLSTMSNISIVVVKGYVSSSMKSLSLHFVIGLTRTSRDDISKSISQEHWLTFFSKVNMNQSCYIATLMPQSS